MTKRSLIITKVRVLTYNKNFSIVRKALTSSVVRYADDVIVVVNDKQQAKVICDKICTFLQERGLNKNLNKSKVFKWESDKKFDYLGFTFHYILGKRFSKITMQRKHTKNFVRSGLYVYPSKLKVQSFKHKVKETIKSNLNVSPYRLVNILNPIIRGWGNYFGVGTLRVFSRLDHYIWYRTWRYLRRKYKKVSTKNLVHRYFQGVQTPSGRTWQFHGTFNSVNKDTMKRKGSVAWLLLLCQLNKPVPAQMFSPGKALVKASYYVDDSIFKEYNLKVVKLRSKKNSVDKWSLLYKKQEGVVLCVWTKFRLSYIWKPWNSPFKKGFFIRCRRFSLKGYK